MLSMLSSDGVEILFNGETLSGWEGDPRLWRVEDGVIVGETDQAGRKLEANSFLVWQGGKPSDFELSYKARVTGNNSGVQYRSKPFGQGKWGLQGYQMDLHPNPPYLGMLYEEKGRGIVCQRGQKVQLSAEAEPALLGELEIDEVDLSEWNDYRIVARKQRLQHFVNGKLAAQITDLNETQRSMEGAIGLQLHVGPAMRAEFKDIELKELAPVLEKGETKHISWIWSEGGGDGLQKRFFRREFKLPEGLESASITSSCDNFHRIWLNGKEVGESGNWAVASVYDVSKLVRAGGKNVIAVEGRNDEGVAGLALSFRATQEGGDKLQVVSDASWLIHDEVLEGWQELDYQPDAWEQAVVVGKMGDEPWGWVIRDEPVREPAKSEIIDDVGMLPGFQLEKIYSVPTEQGSWVAVTADSRGGLICADQYGGLYRVKPGREIEGRTEVEKLDIPLEGAHGLLWFKGALYVTVNEGKKSQAGVYRVEDSNGDLIPDKPVLLKKLTGRGEHGPHALVASPDGEWIYLCAGNVTNLPETDFSWVPKGWDEDQLLPRRPDARGHARDRMAPGGWIARFKPDGSRWELMAIGFRNEYDIAFDEHGELFTYDADMEWDMGMPWYRPTRICQVIPGGDYGWRNGTGKWPSYYEDSVPGTIDIGPGSPTGLLSGKGARFPAKYQRALYALDWTYATIHVVHLTPDGGGYSAELEELLGGKGMPLTDAVIGDDGAMYFLTGGRRTASALWRISYVGEEETEAIVYSDRLNATLGEAEALEALGSEDRMLRQRARLLLENREDALASLPGAGRGPLWQQLGSALIRVRQSEGAETKVALADLCRIDWSKLDKAQKLVWLRVAGLAFIRGDGPTEAEREAVLAKIDKAFPSLDDELNRELCRMLSYLEAPGVVGRTLSLMDSAPPPVAPDWMKLASRNSGYGNDVAAMLANFPSPQLIHYIYCLRVVKGPWQKDERERFFGWLNRLESKSGGKSYAGFLADLRQETLSRASSEELEWLRELTPASVDPFANLPEVEGPGKVWTAEELVAMAGEGWSKSDKKRGEQLYRAVLCAACHSLDGSGGAAGPDLSTLAGRFTAADLAEALIEPSKVISDQYAFDVITRNDGSQLVGRVIEEKDQFWIVATNPFDFSQRVEIESSEVKGVEPSPVSPMPGGLINRLNEEELRDLLAYLLDR